MLCGGRPIPPAKDRPVVLQVVAAAALIGFGIHTVKVLTGTPPPLPPVGASVQPPQETEDHQVVEVSAQIDKSGKPVEIKVTSGNPALFGAALNATRQWEYHPRCDHEGRRVPYVTKLFVVFDRSGHFEKVRPPIEVGNGLTSLRLLRRFEPKYPEELRRKGIGGTVVLQIRLDQKGNVVEAKALRGPTPLYKNAISAALQWKFKPYYFRNCIPIPIIAMITMTFNAPQIRGGSSKSHK